MLGKSGESKLTLLFTLEADQTQLKRAAWSTVRTSLTVNLALKYNRAVLILSEI